MVDRGKFALRHYGFQVNSEHSTPIDYCGPSHKNYEETVARAMPSRTMGGSVTRQRIHDRILRALLEYLW